MPRPTHAQGRPDTRVIPADWNTTHAPVVTKAARGTCSIRPPGTTQTWSDSLDQMVATPKTAYFDGPCRIQALGNQARQPITAGDKETVAEYLIAIGLDEADPVEGDHITIKTGDDALAGQVLRINRVARGTERFERDLFCTLIN